MAETEVEDSSNRINVVVRCRPLSETERGNGALDICRIMEQKLVILMDPGAASSNDYLRMDKSREKRYAFDKAFGPKVETREVFTATTKPLIGAVMHAYNATIFAYGATGAGKTYSMIGSAQAPGVMLLTVESLFEHANASDASIAVKCSFIEVYNENLRDLLAPDGKEGYLDLREDPSKGMAVCGVFETEAESVDEVIDLLCRGNLNRMTEPTAMNVTSSRSHAVLQITVEQKSDTSKEVMLGKLSMVDLAGSERASQTHNSGVRLVEGANINRSLLALGNCINALASGCSFVPYRDSKLTRLLKDSLGGSCRTVMMANISPNHLSYEDTLNTLKYANRAKNIRITARQNIIKPETHVSQYQSMIEDLRGEVVLLKAKLANREAPQVSPSSGDSNPRDPKAALAAQEAGAQWKEEVVQNLESRTQLQRSLVEVERGLTQWHVEKDHASQVIAKWDGTSVYRSTTRSLNSERFGQLRTLEDWRNHLQQIEECIRENIETRKSIQQRLDQNKAAGKELQAQLQHRVLNEDLCTFLELVQRVQVLEVERLELDHVREVRRGQLENHDEEIESLREQLRLRNEHLVAQRQLLTDEQQRKFPRSLSLLGSTLSEFSPVQKRGPIVVMHAWAPAPKDNEEPNSWDGRGARHREPSKERDADDIYCTRDTDDMPQLDIPVDWRNLELPRASQIRGIARIQPPLHPGPKGWREPPMFKSPEPGQPPRMPLVGLYQERESAALRKMLKPQTGPPVNSDGAGSAQKNRGNTCPPLRSATPDRGPIRRPSREDPDEMYAPPRQRVAPRVGIGLQGGMAPPPRRPYEEGTPKSRRRKSMRARSDHTSYRMNKVGRMVFAQR